MRGNNKIQAQHSIIDKIQYIVSWSTLCLTFTIKYYAIYLSFRRDLLIYFSCKEILVQLI